MTSYVDVVRLVHLGECRLASAQAAASRTQRECDALNDACGAVEQSSQGLGQWLAAGYLNTTMVSRSELLGNLRQQAVIRRRLADLALERAQLEQRRTMLNETLSSQLRAHQRLKARQEKIHALKQRLRKSQYAAQQRQQELETEDLIMSTLR